MITYWQARCIEDASYRCVYGLVRGNGGYVSDRCPFLTWSARTVRSLHRKGLLVMVETDQGLVYKATRLGIYEATKRMSKHYAAQLKKLKRLGCDQAAAEVQGG